MAEKLKDIVLKFALQNAIFYGGRANPKAVLGRVMQSSQSARMNVAETRQIVESVVKEVNLLSPDIQKKKLEKIAPELLEKEKKEQTDLPPLPDAVTGKVVTRFAPSPTGPVSLGQFMRAVVLSWAYARKYQGKFIVRLEDTDAKKIEKKFYEWIKEDLKNLGIDYDQFVLQSERVELYHKDAGELIRKGKAYVCMCDAEKFKQLKLEKKDCPDRENPHEKNMGLWERMREGHYNEGEAVVRLKLDMSDPNPVMRDPPIMRVNKTEHPMAGRKYNAWPLYNFSCAIDDHDLGVTHVFRGKEHEHNTAVQKKISDMFGWSFPEVINFGMIRFPGEKLHTRDIKVMIKEGKVSGWDDPRLPTVRAFLRRGFSPEALKGYAIQCGLTKNDIQLSWENLEGHNRKVIDPIANRYMVVVDPVKFSVEGAPPKREVFEPLHPDNPAKGKKKMPVDNTMIYISKDDFQKFEGQEIRLKGLYNIRLSKKPKYTGDQVTRESAKIQWVSEPHVNVTVVTPEGHREGVGEEGMVSLKEGEIIQMERVGFARVDSKEKNKIILYFAHR